MKVDLKLWDSYSNGELGAQSYGIHWTQSMKNVCLRFPTSSSLVLGEDSSFISPNAGTLLNVGTDGHTWQA